jgi:hypothetical protein
VVTEPFAAALALLISPRRSNGVMQDFAPTYYHAVTTPSGVHNQVLKGTVANDTGATVTYSANSGEPIPAGQTCWSFATGAESTDWLMTIEADGHYTLTCHFPAPPLAEQSKKGRGRLPQPAALQARRLCDGGGGLAGRDSAPNRRRQRSRRTT